MDIIKNLTFSISQCEMTDILEEAHRFVLHITLVHVFNYVIDGKDELFGRDLFRMLVVTVIAVISYNVFFKKIISPKLKKAKSACKVPSDDIKAKQVKSIKHE
jgi:hypothetical protein